MNLKNQVMTTNLWVVQVSGFIAIKCWFNAKPHRLFAEMVRLQIEMGSRGVWRGWNALRPVRTHMASGYCTFQQVSLLSFVCLNTKMDLHVTETTQCSTKNPRLNPVFFILSTPDLCRTMESLWSIRIRTQKAVCWNEKLPRGRINFHPYLYKKEQIFRFISFARSIVNYSQFWGTSFRISWISRLHWCARAEIERRAVIFHLISAVSICAVSMRKLLLRPDSENSDYYRF